MAWPQYTNIKVHSTGWVSSSGHHMVYVDLAERRVRTRRIFLIEGQAFLHKDGNGYLKMPQYAIDHVLMQIKQMVIGCTFKFCEYDRNRKPRWENLRYHDEKQFLEMVYKWPTKLFAKGSYQ